MRVRIVFAAALAFGVAALGCGKKKEPPQAPVESAPDEVAAPPDPLKDATAQRLKEIGFAFHTYGNVNGSFPAGVVGPSGNLGLSWRVALLPDLGLDDLYEQFNLKETWDSEHNKKLIPKMPAVFAHPARPAAEGHTHFRALIGHDAFIPLPHPAITVPDFQFHWRANLGRTANGRGVWDFRDGNRDTLMVAEATDAVPWTKPDELFFQDEFVKGGAPKPGPLPKFGGAFPDGFHAVMCDGKVFFFPDSLSATARRALITTSGGERDAEASAIVRPATRTLPAEAPAARKPAVERFQQLARAAQAHLDANTYLPGGYASATGIGLSWRVALLPHLGEEALFKQFKLDEPWDGPTNKPLIEKMPAVFASTGKAAPAGHTFVRTTGGLGGIVLTYLFNSKGQAMYARPKAGEAVRGVGTFQISDGTSNTILFVEAAESGPWTKPDELPIPHRSAYRRGPAVMELGGAFDSGFHAVFVDGTVTFFKRATPKEEVAKMFTPNGREVPHYEELRIEYAVPPK